MLFHRTAPWRRGLAGLSLVAAASLGLAAPFTPASDNEVVEKLPLSATDPSIRRVDSLRKQLAAKPDDDALRIEIARRYFNLAMAQGDPRYVGYAAAAIAPMPAKGQTHSAAYWTVLAMVQQYSHDFEAALQSLDKASQIDPQAVEPMAWRAAIQMVQARYGLARAECERMAPQVHPVFAAACLAYARAASGELGKAYASLNQTVEAQRDTPPELALWALTRLAEMADRLGMAEAAEKHFRRALALGLTDQFLLAAYADFLLAQKRPAEVMRLLADWERSDVLLLRLALAGQASGDRRAKDWARQMRERFAAAGERQGARLHEQEAARFELEVENNPRTALESAALNYQTQREPRDAEILMRSALAAGKPSAAQPAIDWLRDSRYEDPRLAALAKQLQSAGGKP